MNISLTSVDSIWRHKTAFRRKYEDSGLEFFNRSVTWQGPRQQHCRDADQISERCDCYNKNSKCMLLMNVKLITANDYGITLKTTVNRIEGSNGCYHKNIS